MKYDTTKETMDAWYFAQENKKLRYGDNRKIVIGKTHRVRGKIALCDYGLHASARAFDALFYAPGPIVYRVQLHGSILKNDDKVCATARTYVSGGIDATNTIDAFSRWCALEVAHMWDMPPIVRRYLKTGDESIRDQARAAARAAAMDAASAAASAAARDTAIAAYWNTTMDAARDAAMDAARAAASAAASAAARDTAMDAFIDRANTKLEKMLTDLITQQKASVTAP